jgi:YD repeat-containing protein
MTPCVGAALSYGFEASGHVTRLPTGATGAYDDAGRLVSLLLSGTTTSYTYNADGEQLSATQGSTTFSSGTWNGAGELMSYWDPTADMISGTYDGDGLRAFQT